MNYEEAVEYLSKGRNKDDRPIGTGRNTRLQRRDHSAIAVKYSNTDVVTYLSNGDAILESDGWLTVTTKARMNEYVEGFRIYQEDGAWYVVKRLVGETGAFLGYDWGNPIPYADGMVLHPDGTVSGAGQMPDKKLKRQASRYATNYIKALVAGKVPAPGPGDCWHCSMRVGAGDIQTGTLHPDGSLTNQASVGLGFSGKTLGEAGGHPEDHIISHIEEKYYVPSLLVRAMEIFPTSMAMEWALWDVWRDGDGEWINDRYIQQQLRSVLRRYIYRQLGFAA